MTDTTREAPGRRRRRRALTTVLVLALSGGGTYAYLSYDRAEPAPGVNDVAPQDAQQQATLVDQEDLRVMQTRAVLSSALARGGARAAQVRQPHIASSANGRTLVLTARSAPYYVADLERFAQEDFQRQSDGSYLLSINLFVAHGAKLVLQSATGPLDLRLSSEPGAFTSIVGFGASIRVNGSAQNPVRITGWDAQAGAPDTRVADGRAYIRAIGGELRMRHTHVSHLGFWSGRTGGIALTGSDRPSDSAEDLQKNRWRPERRTVLMPDGRRETTGGGMDAIEVAPARGGAGTGFQVPSANLVTGAIENSTVTGNAYGIFITASNRTEIRDTTVTGSLVHGVLMHRFARNATIENTTVRGSRGDGFVLSRATEKVSVTGCLAEGNGGNGFTLNGLPLAEGPSASGEATEGFGDSSVISSTARDNGRYGIELLGGVDLAVQTSRVVGGDMGIVVGDGARGVRVSGNELTGQRRQGIAVRDGVTGARISGNIIRQTRTGLFVRGSSAQIDGNTVHAATLHGVSLVGPAGGTRISGNTFGGAGRSAVDLLRATGPVDARDNNTRGWRDTADLTTQIRRIAKPMNVIWAGVFLLVVVSALRSRNAGPLVGRRGAHPYERQRRLEHRQAVPLPTRAAQTAAGAGERHDELSGAGTR
ncbi:right-handed parallel beta-helix repeat-containing protein [Thermomonospora amylolytica]|uniref:right-handed parallel beta-helix repeat-containing protein n=1 Tax=Thermomonospora amylolytica TaxID=1411117 RepID=UPI000E6BBF66|nr:right-handed parallel beta-helix repeat-containing protein [Thermomonospora amylolytica]